MSFYEEELKRVELRRRSRPVQQERDSFEDFVDAVLLWILFGAFLTVLIVVGVPVVQRVLE